jgi:hypothetical protein
MVLDKLKKFQVHNFKITKGAGGGGDGPGGGGDGAGGGGDGAGGGGDGAGGSGDGAGGGGKGQVCQHLPDQPIVRSEDLPVHVNVVDTSSDGESLSDEDKDENGNPKGYKCLGTFVIPR